MDDSIIIRGAREHNLKNVSLTLPKRKLIVFTGLSGSGKSSLAFDTLYAEGQRRYIESLSAYARQFLGQLRKPDVDSIEGLSPAISIDQRATSHNPRSTVGTVTEIYDYLRLLYAKVGTVHCGNCGRVVSALSVDQMVDHILERALSDKRPSVTIWAPVVDQRKGEFADLLATLYKRGFAEAEVDGGRQRLSADPKPLARFKQHTIRVFVDTVPIDDDHLSQLAEAIETSLDTADGRVEVELDLPHSAAVPSGVNDPKNSRGFSGGVRKLTQRTRGMKRRTEDASRLFFNTKRACAHCGQGVPDYEPRSFSFNSPYGACTTCDGLGTEEHFDPALIVPDRSKTIREGAILPWSYRLNNYYGALLAAVAEHYRIPLDRPVRGLDPADVALILDGPPEPVRIPVRYWSDGTERFYNLRFVGIVPHLERRLKETESPRVREELAHYLSVTPCRACGGARLKPEALLVTIGGSSIAELTTNVIDSALAFFANLKVSARDELIAAPIVKEIRSRLQFLIDVGLNYLTLNRQAGTLAGGEAQRIRLASQIGSALTGILYVLDEPSIGLHPRDSGRLVRILKTLRDLGNTVIVVEHDEAMMREADHLIDIGPRAGRHGGEIVAQGDIRAIAAASESITGQYLTGQRTIAVPKKRRAGNGRFLSVIGATEHNLKRLRADLPLGTFTCVTGVSGSGKSTLVDDVLYRAVARSLNRTLDKPGAHRAIEGVENIQKVIPIDQSPIGRTPRSNPATYTGVFTPIRELFASLPEARARGYAPGRFSFNVSGGRCEHCQGDGSIQVAMQFLPDVYVPCDVCHSARYNRETLAVLYRGHSIAQVLRLSVTDALEVFEDLPRITNVLQVLERVGLGYIELGQAATTLSGGEAQRVKLATELAKSSRGKTLYILDEPTTGLHLEDVTRLLEVLNALVDAGHTVLVIEHHLDVIKQADHVIDLGPEGGDAGGQVVATGTPEEIATVEGSHTGRFLQSVLKRKED